MKNFQPERYVGICFKAMWGREWRGAWGGSGLHPQWTLLMEAPQRLLRGRDTSQPCHALTCTACVPRLKFLTLPGAQEVSNKGFRMFAYIWNFPEQQQNKSDNT